MCVCMWLFLPAIWCNRFHCTLSCPTKKITVSDIRTGLLVCHLHQNAPERPSSLKDQLPQVGCMSILKGQRSLDLLTRTYVRDDLHQISRNCCKRPNFSFRLCYGKTSRYIQPGFFSYEQNVLVKKEGATTGILLSRWSLVTPKLSALVRIPHFFFPLCKLMLATWEACLLTDD